MTVEFIDYDGTGEPAILKKKQCRKLRIEVWNRKKIENKKTLSLVNFKTIFIKLLLI